MWTGELEADTAYFINLWSATGGAANYIATLETDSGGTTGDELAIVSQPTDLTVTEGDDATFNVSATGSGALTYQWLVGTTEIPGETGSSLILPAVSLADTGAVYSVRVSDANGFLISDVVTLTVNPNVPVTGVIFGEGLVDSTRNLGPKTCLLYTSPSPRDRTRSRMPSSA